MCGFFGKLNKCHTNYSGRPTGYHRIFSAHKILLKMPFKRMKALFSKDFVKVGIFPNLTDLCFLSKKTSQWRWKRRSQEKKSFNAQSTAKLLLLPLFKKSGFLQILFKNTNFRKHWKNLTISVAFYRKFANIWWKKFQIPNMHILLQATFGKWNQKTLALSWWFSVQFMNMAEKNNFFFWTLRIYDCGREHTNPTWKKGKQMSSI